MSSVLGTICESISAAKLMLSVSASPKVRLPEIVALPVTVKSPPILTLPVVVTVSVYVSLNLKLVVPKSMSLSVTGIIAPSAIYNCCTGAEDTST